VNPSIEILKRDESEPTEYWSHIIKIVHKIAAGRLNFSENKSH
jgi:hypothetical protein